VKKLIGILLIFCIMFTAGCTNKEPIDSDEIQPDGILGFLGVTVEGYEAMTLDMTYEQVCVILEEGRETWGIPVPHTVTEEELAIALPEGSLIYMWESNYFYNHPDWEGRNYIYACFFDNKLVAKRFDYPLPANAAPDSDVTLERAFGTVELGSNYQKVADVMQDRITLRYDYVDKTQHYVGCSCGKWPGISLMLEFSNDSLVLKEMRGADTPHDNWPVMAEEDYEKIKLGMTYDEVRIIAKSDGRLVSETVTVGKVKKIYSWGVGWEVDLTFENNILIDIMLTTP